MSGNWIAGRTPAISMAIAACALGGAACGGHASERSGGNVGASHAWQDFFSFRAPISERIALAQDGHRFAGLIRSRPGRWPGARTAAVVHTVSLAGVCAMLATRGTVSAAALPPACGSVGLSG
ncbi:MAG: hypothetical protein ACYCPF_00895 [Streptosporangiaceae bacterium]